MRVVAEHVYRHSFGVTLLRGIFAGWLIALMVWLRPAFPVFTGERSWAEFALTFFIPALIGNIIGGVVLVAAINHAQTKPRGEGDGEELIEPA